MGASSELARHLAERELDKAEYNRQMKIYQADEQPRPKVSKYRPDFKGNRPELTNETVKRIKK